MTVAALTETVSTPIFTEPFRDWEPERILDYFASRKHIRYFPVPDEKEVTREKTDRVVAGEFDFNGECHRVESANEWLRNPSSDIEWLILLHKFYYAAGLGIAYQESKDESYASRWVELTSTWIDTVPLDFLPSDVAGRRIQNWIYAHYYFVTLSCPKCVTPAFYLSFLSSLNAQVRYLREHLTPARNHRTLELCALFWVAVVFPEFQDSSEWLEYARAELLHNMQTDLLPDGVQCELSLDYHHIVLRNYLSARRLAAMNDVRMPSSMDGLIQKALIVAIYAHNPAGIVPALSDGDRTDYRYLLQQGYDLYQKPEMLYVATNGALGKAPRHPSVCFRSSGYVILRSGWGERRRYEDELHLLFDCGPLGAGNHGHFDLLSFELAAYGRSLILDPGRYTYDESGDINFRALFRGTGYHNTVLVDGRNQTRYEFRKRKFKVTGPAPDHELRTFVSNEHFDYVHGVARSHEYPVVHERKICFVRPNYFVICDELKAEDAHNYELLFHLSDEASGRVRTIIDQGTVCVQTPHLVLAQAFDSSISTDVRAGYISYSYGSKREAPIVGFGRNGADVRFVTVVYPYGEYGPAISMDPSAVGDGKVRVTIHAGDRQLVDEIGFEPTGGLSLRRETVDGFITMGYEV